jgi:MYXO-CTERM domain-containing protein
MLVTNHVLSGALIGATVRRPLPAFALGVVSHFALDAVPHWGKFGSISGGGMLRVAVPDGLAGLAVIGTFAAIAPRERRLSVLAGMAGAALPDIDKPSRLFFNRSPFPRAVDAFHSAIQDEAPDRAHYELAAGAVLAVGALAVLRRRS